MNINGMETKGFRYRKEGGGFVIECGPSEAGAFFYAVGTSPYSNVAQLFAASLGMLEALSRIRAMTENAGVYVVASDALAAAEGATPDAQKQGA